WMVRVAGDGRLTPWEGDELFHGVYRRQNLPPAHVPDGGVIALTRRALTLGATAAAPVRTGQASEPQGRVGHASEPAGDAAANPEVRLSPHAFLGADRRAVVTEPGEVIDIDSPVDLMVADAALR